MSETKTNLFRREYRKLTDPEIFAMNAVKDAAAEFDQVLTRYCQPCRETSIARTNLETCVMWAVKGITG